MGPAVEKHKIVLLAVIVLAIVVAGYVLFLSSSQKKEVLSRDAVVRDILDSPGDNYLGVDPETVKILTAELMDFAQLPESEQEMIKTKHEKVWMVSYECWGAESNEIMEDDYKGVIYHGWMQVRRVLDAYTGDRLLRDIENIRVIGSLIVTTDKDVYLQGENMRITVKNMTNKEMEFSNTAYGLGFEKWDNTTWQPYVGIRGGEAIVALGPGGESIVTYTLGGYIGYNFEPGEYRVGTAGYGTPPAYAEFKVRAQ
jgi:hypothetical protein